VILAVDGGNSKTDVALVATNGRLLAATRGPTTSHQQVGLRPGIEQLASLVAEVRSLAGLKPTAAPAAVGAFGLAGADTPGDTRRLTDTLAAHGLASRIVVVNDAFTPIRAGTDRGWGIALICGSGVNAGGIAPDGRTARLTALGDISGDWGGGGDIGMTALGAAVRGRDGRGPRTVLETLVPAHFGYSRPIDLTRALEAGTVQQTRVRELAPIVFRAAVGGDAVARSIIDRQADELVAMAGAIVRRLRLARRDPEVILAGGVFAARDDAFEERIRDGVRRVAPHATVRRSDALPVLGAALLGLDRLSGLEASGRSRAAARLRSSLGAWRPGPAPGARDSSTT
jgi:N-acetylglucosamine kinase-like BadF-type ATPase